MNEQERGRFYQGDGLRAYDLFGAHFTTVDGVDGVRFDLYAPHARSVRLIGQFNGWDRQATPMTKIDADCWEVFVPGVAEYAMYKYIIEQADGRFTEKADPYAFYSELRPAWASKAVRMDDYQWHDGSWMAQRTDNRDRPMNIYECHLGGFMRKPDGGVHTYYEMIDLLVPYVSKMGYTHIELMPLNEYPLDASWGYQQYGYFAPTARYGNAYQLKMLIDACHRAGLGVIMDIVVVHFAVDDYGLRMFDGTPLYESGDRSRAVSQWGTLYFDYSKPAVTSFLMSSAGLWLDKYHVDGLRVDAVSNLIFLDGDKTKGPNHGGVDFIKRFNIALHAAYKGIMTIAEDSSDYPHVTQPVDQGGLGFDYKWDLGWMNDTLGYYKLDPIYRQYHHNELTFSMAYFWAERFILPLSHDEVVHSKATIVNKMWGLYGEKFAQCKNLMVYMYAHPGKKLSFMGNEIATFREFDENRELDWFLLKYPAHDAYQRFTRDLNAIYRDHPAFWRFDYDCRGFEWIDADNSGQQIYSFMRYDENSCYLVVLNMSPVSYEDYVIGVPSYGYYTEIINSERDIYGGCNMCNFTKLRAVKPASHGRPYHLKIRIAPFAGLIFQGRTNASDHRQKKG